MKKLQGIVWLEVFAKMAHHTRYRWLQMQTPHWDPLADTD